MLRNLFALLRSFAVLYAFLYLGKGIVWLLPLGIPANIWGLILLFLSLNLRLLPLSWVHFSANLLVRYMAVLFIPVSVGVMEYWDLLQAQFILLFLPNILSTLLALVGIALLADYLFQRTTFSHLRQKALKKRLAQPHKS